MNERNRTLRVPDETARRLARSLIRGARHGALASSQPDDGGPLASLVLTASDEIGHPLILVSDLSRHTEALLHHPACSLLFADDGIGDPLARPRISVFGRAEQVEDTEAHTIRRRFLARHPSAERYCDFSDFRFMRIVLSKANLIGGFAQAYELEPADLVDTPSPSLSDRLHQAVAHMNESRADAIDTIAFHLGGVGEGWTIVTADSRGFEITRDDLLRRVEFIAPVRTPDDIGTGFDSVLRRALTGRQLPRR